MKKRLRRAFSIIELVIVIAIIAILAAVLIPTFANVVHKANESADVQVVRQINTVLSTEKPETFADVKELLGSNGITADNCTPIASGRTFYWAPEANTVVYYDDAKEQVVFPEDFAYEKKATWMAFPGDDTQNVVIVGSGTTTISVIADNKEQTAVTISAPAGSTTASALRLTVKDITSGGLNLLTDSAGEHLVGNYSFEISLEDENGNAVRNDGGAVYTAELLLPKGISSEIQVTHVKEGTAVALQNVATKADNTFSYDQTTGILTIYTSSFSPFNVSWSKSETNSSIVDINDTSTGSFWSKYNSGSTSEEVKYMKLTEDGSITFPQMNITFSYATIVEWKIPDIVNSKDYLGYSIDWVIIPDEGEKANLYSVALYFDTHITNGHSYSTVVEDKTKWSYLQGMVAMETMCNTIGGLKNNLQFDSWKETYIIFTLSYGENYSTNTADLEDIASCSGKVEVRLSAPDANAGEYIVLQALPFSFDYSS